MQSLSETEWDVVISGTGLQQSLLALALSRSNNKVLHVDQNEYYGGAEAAFSLQEVEEWVVKVNAGNIPESFLNASFTKSTNNDDASDFEKLSFSRAYTLALSPQIIYSRSKLLSQLVSSKVYRQLEFQAVGNWWEYEDTAGINTTRSEVVERLKRIPNGREDVFSDDNIDVRAKRNLMKFLKFVVDYENHIEVWQSHAEESLPVFLSTTFNLPPLLQTTIIALTLSLNEPSQITVLYALPRIARHLTSVGIFGPGFAAVIPKWGGSSEIAQVACRAGAVGGGVYILGTGVKASSSVAFAEAHSNTSTEALSDAWRNHTYRREPQNKDSPGDPAWGIPHSISASQIQATLTNNEVIRTKALIRSRDSDYELEGTHLNTVSKMISVVSSDLASLFTTTVEGEPTAAVSVVAFPSNSIRIDDQLEPHPVYIMAHSSDTGECPVGQCVLYASCSSAGNSKARLEVAITTLLNCFPIEASAGGTDNFKTQRKPKILYSSYYEQRPGPSVNSHRDNICGLACPSLDLAFDDTTLDNVEDAWRNVMEVTAGDQVSQADLIGTYMRFEDREHMAEEEDYDGA